MRKLKEFIKSLLSRRIMLWFVQKLLFIFVFLTLSNEMYIVALYLINTVFDLFLLNEINVKPIDAKIDISKNI